MKAHLAVALLLAWTVAALVVYALVELVRFAFSAE
jgi:hypothetical protein